MQWPFLGTDGDHQAADEGRVDIVALMRKCSEAMGTMKVVGIDRERSIQPRNSLVRYIHRRQSLPNIL